MAITAAKLEAEVTADVSGFKRGMDEVGREANNSEGRFKGLFGTLGKVGVAAAAAGGAAAVGFGVKAVMAASDFNETLSQSQQVFGSAAGDIEKWSKTAATSFGQSQQAALAASATFGNMFVQLGIGADEAAKMAKSQTELASDFASFYNTSPEQAIEAMTAAYRGEFDAVQKFVPTINAAAVEEKALAMGLKATSKELTAQDKALATNALLTEGAGKAAGDFDRTSEGLANQMRILRARAMDVAGSVGQHLLPIVSKALAVFMEWAPVIGKHVAGALKSLASFFAPVIANIRHLFDMFRDAARGMDMFVEKGDVLGSIVVGMGKAFRGIGSAIQSVRDALGGAGDSADGTGRKMSGLGSLMQSAGAFFTVFKDTVTQALANLQPVIEGFVRTFQTNMAWVQQIMPQVGETISHVLNVIKAVWQAVGDDILNIVVAVFRTIQRVIEAAMKVVRGVITTVLALINGDWGKAWDGIKLIFAGVWDAIGAILRGALSILQSILGAALSAIRILWDKAWAEVAGFLSKTWDGIRDTVAGALDRLRAAVSNGVSDVVAFWRGLPGKITGAIGDLAGTLGRFAGTALEAMRGAVSRGLDAVMEYFRNAPGNILRNLGNLSNLLLDVGADIVSGLVRGIRNGIDKVVAAARAIVDAIPGPIKKLLGIRSPSKVMAGLGREVSAGMAVGIRQDADKVGAAAKALANVAAIESEGGLERFIGALDVQYQVLKALAESAAAVVSDAVDTIQQKLRDAVDPVRAAGEAIAQGLHDTVMDGMSRLAEDFGRSMAQVVRDAEDGARKAVAAMKEAQRAAGDAARGMADTATGGEPAAAGPSRPRGRPGANQSWTRGKFGDGWKPGGPVDWEGLKAAVAAGGGEYLAALHRQRSMGAAGVTVAPGAVSITVGSDAQAGEATRAVSRAFGQLRWGLQGRGF